MSASDFLCCMGMVFGIVGALNFAMSPEAYLEYLPLFGVGGALVGASLALDKPPRRK